MFKKWLEKLHNKLEKYLFDETYEQLEEKYYTEMMARRRAEDEAERYQELYEERRCG